MKEALVEPAPYSSLSAQRELNWKCSLMLVFVAAVAFQLAYTFAVLSFLIAVYLWCLFQLTRLKTSRQAFYFALAAGFLAGAPQSNFFWTIFGPAAIALWFVLAFWIALFVLLGRLARFHFGEFWGVLLIPFLWMGLEYFRSELYYLRFSWLNAGYVFSASAGNSPVGLLGVYGTGFLMMAVIAAIELFGKKRKVMANFGVLALLAGMVNIPPSQTMVVSDSSKDVIVAGVQMEAPSEPQALRNLDKLVKTYPDAKLLLLSEYTFTEPVPDSIKDWCRKNQRYLVVGAEDPAPNSNYYDTAFVIGPAGEIVFRQGKCVPIQFFKDGLPAKEQKLWDSPWGKIGFCVCYDLSYTRVTDELIRMGAQAIIVPTMDVVDWGRHQHELHARVAPTRAAEYGVPIFRLASSGISQFVNGDGKVLATAPMPGEEAMLSAPLHFATRRRLPWDRFIAPVAVAITGIAMCWFVFRIFKKSKVSQPKQT
jgi:apolipoprotein N-acyltransferase